MGRLKFIVLPIILVLIIVFSVSFSYYANNYEDDTFLFDSESNNDIEDEALNNNIEINYVNNTIEEETIETKKKIIFFEETREGLDINDYEREELRKFYDIEIFEGSINIDSKGIENNKIESGNYIFNDDENVVESVVGDIVLENAGLIESINEITNNSYNENKTYGATEKLSDIINKVASKSDIESEEEFKGNEENEEIATISEVKEINEVNSLSTNFLGSGNHPSTASPSVVIHSTYDRYEIYTGENAGTVSISDDNCVYYNGNTNVKVIRDMIDTHNNSPILLNLASNVQFFDFDNSNNNYVLLPDGFI